MASKTDTLVEEIYTTMLDKLLERVKKGEATPTDIKNIRDLARDHGVQLTINPVPGNKIGAVDLDDYDDNILPFKTVNQK